MARGTTVHISDVLKVPKKRTQQQWDKKLQFFTNINSFNLHIVNYVSCEVKLNGTVRLNFLCLLEAVLVDGEHT